LLNPYLYKSAEAKKRMKLIKIKNLKGGA
jgi:hypothetical protein